WKESRALIRRLAGERSFDLRILRRRVARPAGSAQRLCVQHSVARREAFGAGALETGKGARCRAGGRRASSKSELIRWRELGKRLVGDLGRLLCVAGAAVRLHEREQLPLDAVAALAV